jgi:hypothetical protein
MTAMPRNGNASALPRLRGSLEAVAALCVIRETLGRSEMLRGAEGRRV